MEITKKIEEKARNLEEALANIKSGEKIFIAEAVDKNAGELARLIAKECDTGLLSSYDEFYKSEHSDGGVAKIEITLKSKDKTKEGKMYGGMECSGRCSMATGSLCIEYGKTKLEFGSYETNLGYWAIANISKKLGYKLPGYGCWKIK